MIRPLAIAAPIASSPERAAVVREPARAADASRGRHRAATPSRRRGVIGALMIAAPIASSPERAAVVRVIGALMIAAPIASSPERAAVVRVIGALMIAALIAGCADERRRSKPEPPPPPEPVELAASRGEAPIEYTVTFEDARSHHVDVAMAIDTGGAAELELMMAVWTPGSYLVREYARHIETIEAASEAGAVPLRKTRKNRWRLDTGGAARITVRYRLWARESTVRTNFVDADLAMLNGAPTFLTARGYESRPHAVALEIPETWERIVTALRPIEVKNKAKSEAESRFIAASFDELVDSPIVAGNPDYRTFEIGGAEHILATFLAGARWDGEKAASDISKLVAEQHDLWQLVPYRRYAFLQVMLGGGGGLEHKDSTLMVFSRNVGDDPARYRRWLGLVSHEMFHTWNGKRLRPVELGPFDYENEVYTRGLWVVEGITSYYDDLILARAGLMSRAQYLEALSGQIASLQRTAGRTLQPLSRASYDAWIEYYRGDENSGNTAVSYYTKGAVVAFLLDAEIRRLTGDRESLDDLMRLTYRRYSAERGFTVAEWRAAAEEVAGADLSGFFARYVDGTDELDYAPALAHFGLRFAAAKKTDDDKKTGYLGVDTGGDRVSRVIAGSPAEAAGVNVGDEIIAVDGERVGRGLDAELEPHKPGARVELTVARRGLLRTIEVKLGEKPDESFKLERLPQPSAAQSARFSRWLGPSAEDL
jgi:predicted metalloprotease with PDZ domain